MKKNSVNIFCKFANFLAILWTFLNINVCLKVHSFSYNNSILHNFFYQWPVLKKKHGPNAIEKNFDIKKDAHIFLLDNVSRNGLLDLISSRRFFFLKKSKVKWIKISFYQTLKLNAKKCRYLPKIGSHFILLSY